MRLLLDECIDRRLAREFKDHTVKTVPQMGWAGVKNGRLISLAEKEFEVFVTVDQNLSFQQKLSKFDIAIIILNAPTNKLSTLKLLVPRVLSILQKIERRQTITVSL